MSALFEPSPQPERLKALVVDDAPELRMLLEPLLTREGFDVRTASDGTSSVELARTFAPDVIVLDLVMPGLDGLEACRRIRTFSDAYIVMVTSKDAEVDKVVGLSVGADDYVAKPFSPVELVARVRAMLRRPRKRPDAEQSAAVQSGVTDSMTMTVGDIRIDRAAREVTIAGSIVDLTRIEFDLLETLCSRPRMVFSRSQLLELVWGPNWYGDTHVVDVHMSNLRRKLGDRSKPPRFIQTVRGIGFRLTDEALAATRA